MMRSIKLFTIPALSAVFVLGLIGQSDAQTKKKKHTAKRPATTTRIQQPLYTSEPIIVSRASDYDKPTDDSVTTVAVPVTQDEPTERDRVLADISARIKNLEKGMKNGYDEKQKTLLLNLDILTRAEQRSESLRKQRFELIEKENTIQTRLDQIEYDVRPEMVERSVALTGSLRPEELRENRAKSLEAEKQKLTTLLTEVQNMRASLEVSVKNADDLVERLRTKLEKDIDSAISDDKPE